ncbi:MAG: hypothetical protein COV08_00270 [Candidatus Vogelbacteria bacterium CG10_big_fil_rev_8_21_14_0_10_49_38]|uniref:Pilus assembly protein PilO n=1 Tax=Candidatus Vogelbacteria bacterium CG10_big_fil_rev_8_21_14_0_10_49_38 TaxID=1975043 RepID=A0A2H0RIS0_9BACT|nr:MAG: hypothetical protein BK006_00270 [bacterium CG10_49_38]PIR46357.1 MAG: hypothetical protein COV08_00270 [Candidatus Vogelbacteria bacterium CG10_big_fil_rev_8_21_14_0_10_49_38]
MFRLSFLVLSLVVSGLIVFWAAPIILNGSADPIWQKTFLGQESAGLKELLEEKKILNEALINADKIKDKIAELNRAEESISAEDLAKLEKFIPDHIDNINLIIDVNNIAFRHGLSLKDVKVREAEARATQSTPLTGQNQISETFISFSVAGDYAALISFLDGLANSLRVADVTNLSFSVDNIGVNQYNFEVKTYWVK